MVYETIISYLDCVELSCNTDNMAFLKPSIAKIVTTFFIGIVLSVISIPLVGSISFNINWYVTVLILVVLFYIAYIISCSIWIYGKNHRRFSIIFFSFFSSVFAFYICSLISSFYGSCLNANMELPCGGDLGSCHAQPPCPPNMVEIIFHYVSIVIPLFIILLGIILFIKAGKTPRNKVKK